MLSVIGKMFVLVFQVEHIPGGFTPLCQIIEVGFNHPLKTMLRNIWDHWIDEAPENGAKNIEAPS